MLPKIRRILYGTALSAGAPYVFGHALGLAQQYDAHITVVHAMEPLTGFAQSLVDTYLMPEKNAALHQENLQKVQNTLKAKLEKNCQEGVCNDAKGETRVDEIRVLEGRPELVLLNEAKRCGADLIVIGTHRHSAAHDALLGSTANRVIHSAEIPVLLVRIPKGYEEEGV